MGELTSLVITLLFVAVVLTGGLLFMEGMTEHHTVDQVEHNMSFSNETIRSIKNLTSTASGAVKQGGVTSIVDTPFVVLSGAYSAIMTLFQIPNVIGYILTDLQSLFGIPKEILAVFFAIVSFFVLMKIISVLFRFDI